MSVRASSLLLSAALVATAGACATTAVVSMPQPVARGGIAPNSIQHFDYDRAYALGLPQDTFREEAQLVALDARRVCFAITLRTDGERAELATPGAWRISLRAEPELLSESPVFGPPSQLRSVTLQGLVIHTIDMAPPMPFGCGRFTFGGCMGYPRYGSNTISTRTPVNVNVLTGGGAVCFAHGGVLDARTRTLSLSLEDPESAARSYVFRWEFTP